MKPEMKSAAPWRKVGVQSQLWAANGLVMLGPTVATVNPVLQLGRSMLSRHKRRTRGPACVAPSRSTPRTVPNIHPDAYVVVCGL